MMSVREPGSQMCVSKGDFDWGTHQEDNIGVLVEGSGHTDSLPLTTRQVDTLSPKQRKRSCPQPFRFSLCTWSSMRRWSHPRHQSGCCANILQTETFSPGWRKEAYKTQRAKERYGIQEVRKTHKVQKAPETHKIHGFNSRSNCCRRLQLTTLQEVVQAAAGKQLL